MDRSPLTFSEIEKQIQAMPDGPAAVLESPKWAWVLYAIGAAGVVTCVTPFVLIQFMRPQMWMVEVSKIGLWIAIVAYIPGIIRTIGVLAVEFWQWRPKLVEQSDHDIARFRELRSWLTGYPSAELKEHRNFARLSQERLASKLGILMGSIDKLGVLPALVALLVLLGNTGEITLDRLLAAPGWQIVLALFLPVIYFIGLLAALMRLRLQLYEAVLSDALQHSACVARVGEAHTGLHDTKGCRLG